MSRRRAKHPGVTDMGWNYLHDRAVSDHPAGYEYSLLASNQHDHETGYRTSDIWEKYREQILADWIRKHPRSRPWCWWKFDSGLPHVYRLEDGGIIEDTQPVPVRLFLCGRNQRNTRMLTAEELEAQRGQFLLDQHRWLAEHGHLTESE